MTLAEIMVAMTVFVVASAVALILYNALSRSYKLGENAADVQQATRIAFENVLTDMRMLGFNFNPDGTERPDEQLEGAWETAITFRGDFDFEDPAASASPEAALAGGPYNVVSVGNDEIVTYALAKPDGSSTGSLTFRADVTPAARDGVAENVTINNIALVHNDPPYTLYRITVNNNSTNTTRQPVADNVYVMQYRYYDAGGALLGPSTPADPSDDIGGSDSVGLIDLRSRVRRLEVSLTGLTPDPDLSYTDPDDPYVTTRNHRKFTLTQDVTPRNAGYVGRPDIDTIPPTPPTGLVACPGQCEGVLLSWDTPPATDVVDQWTILQGTTPSALGSPVTTKTDPTFLEGLTGGPYYFRVRAEDSTGNVSGVSNLATPAPVTVADATTPSAVSFLSATGDDSGSPPAAQDSIRLIWGGVDTNVESLACDPQPTKIRDMLGYRLYRAESPGNLVGGGLSYIEPEQLPPGTVDYVDRNVVACRRYYYDITAVDKCGNESAPLPANQDGMATTSYAPGKPGGVQAVPAGGDTNVISWARVTSNTNDPPDPIRVDTYRVYRLASSLPPTTDEATWKSTALSWDVTVSDVNNPTWTDVNAIALPAGQDYYYRVSALDDCPNEGPLSSIVQAVACDFGGFIYVMDPYDFQQVSIGTQVNVYVEVFPEVAETFEGWVQILDPYGNPVSVDGLGSPASPQAPPITGVWSTAGLAPGEYKIQATFTNSQGCSSSVTSTVALNVTAACCIAPLAPVLGPVSGQLSTRFSDVLFSLVNNCGEDLQITGQDVVWTNLTGNNTLLNDFCFDVPELDSKGDPTLPQDCVPDLTFSPAARSPVSVTISPPFQFPATRDDFNPLQIGYKFTDALITGTNLDDIGEQITVDMFYRTSGSTSDAQCRFIIETNPLTIAVDGN